MKVLPCMTLLAPTGLIYDKRKQGWKLLEEGPKVEGESTLTFLGFVREGEVCVNGQTVLARTAEMDGSESGQHHLEHLLRQAHRIPAELRPYYLVATGTKWENSDGGVCIPHLRFVGDRWVFRFRCVEDGRWSDDGRVVRVCQQPEP